MKVKPWIGTVLSLVAGIILLTTWASLIGNPFYMHWELLWVGWRPNVVARVCFAVGWAILVHVGALLLCVKPRHRRLAATLILASSALTLLFWADGYLHRNASRDAIFPRWTFLWHLIYPDAPPLFRPFDLLPIASAIGVAGGVLTVLWKPQPNRDSVRSEAWVNHIGVFSAITAFGSLGLTWWVWTFRIFIFPWGTVSFYPPYLWVSRLAAGMYVALVLMLLGGTLGLLGSLVAGKMGRLSLLASGICHVLSTAIFATALQSELEQGGLTVFFIAFYRVGFNLFHWWFEADLLSYLSFGFWTALASGFIALAALLGHPAPSMGTVNPRAKDDDN